MILQPEGQPNVLVMDQEGLGLFLDMLDAQIAASPDPDAWRAEAAKRWTDKYRPTGK